MADAAITKLGRVGLVFKGNYDPQAYYKRLDVVTDRGNSYAAKVDHSGIATINEDVWQLLAERGKSAYEAAKALGLTDLTEEEWLHEYDSKRDDAIEAIEKKGAETLAGIPADYTALAGKVSQLSEEMLTKAPAIKCEASGSIVSITDAAAQPVVKLISHIEPMQSGSGDASPNNIRLISGWENATAWHSGINMLDADALVQGDVDGSSETVRVSLPLASRPLVKAGNTYTLAFSPADTRDRMWALTTDAAGALQEIFQEGGDNSAASCMFTPTKDGYFTPLYGRRNDTNTGWDSIDTASVKSLKPYLKLGHQTEYTKYKGKKLLAQLPETLYGGLVKWLTGELIADRQIVLLSDLAWEAYTSWGSDHTFCAEAFSHAGLSEYEASMVLLEAYKPLTQTDALSGNETGFYVRPDTGGLYISDERYTDAEAFAAAVTGRAIYPLASPYTIQLTPYQLFALEGINNAWSDRGDTTLSYIADTKRYIDQKLAAIAAATLNN